MNDKETAYEHGSQNTDTQWIRSASHIYTWINRNGNDLKLYNIFSKVQSGYHLEMELTHTHTEPKMQWKKGRSDNEISCSQIHNCFWTLTLRVSLCTVSFNWHWISFQYYILECDDSPTTIWNFSFFFSQWWVT